MEDESGFTRSIIGELHSSDIQRDKKEGGNGVTRSIIDDPQSLHRVKWKVKLVLPEVSMMNFILGTSKEIKWQVKVVLLEVSLINFILRISKQIKWKVKVVLLRVSLMNFNYRI